MPHPTNFTGKFNHHLEITHKADEKKRRRRSLPSIFSSVMSLNEKIFHWWLHNVQTSLVFPGFDMKGFYNFVIHKIFMKSQGYCHYNVNSLLQVCTIMYSPIWKCALTWNWCHRCNFFKNLWVENCNIHLISITVDFCNNGSCNCEICWFSRSKTMTNSYLLVCIWRCSLTFN